MNVEEIRHSSHFLYAREIRASEILKTKLSMLLNALKESDPVLASQILEIFDHIDRYAEDFIPIEVSEEFLDICVGLFPQNADPN